MFKIGDKVRVIDDTLFSNSGYIGKIGTIKNIFDTKKFQIEVSFSNGDNNYFTKEELEIIREEKSDNLYMENACSSAIEGVFKGYGGGFGAVIVKNNKIISKAHNTVIKDSDCTAHAEINAIRQACNTLGTHDLDGCVLYTTSEPCPMCLGAIMWANIKTVYYGCSCEYVGNIVGFRDDFMYKWLENRNENILKLIQEKEELCKKPHETWMKNNGKLY